MLNDLLTNTSCPVYHQFPICFKPSLIFVYMFPYIYNYIVYIKLLFYVTSIRCVLSSSCISYIHYTTFISPTVLSEQPLSSLQFYLKNKRDQVEENHTFTGEREERKLPKPLFSCHGLAPESGKRLL